MDLLNLKAPTGLHAFGGGGVGLATVGVVYLTGSALAQRLATFWLPVPPGSLAFHHLTRRGML